MGLVLLLLVALAAAGARAEPVKVLAFGDSLVAGHGLGQREAFPARLEAALRARGHRVAVVNAGVSGETTAGGRARLDWTLAEKPDAVILTLGGNDMLRGLSPEAAFANLDAILAELEERDIPVLLTGMRAPANMGADYVAAFDSVYRRLAERHDVLFYPFFLDGVATVPGLNQPDGIHPNAAGVGVIVERLLPLAEKLIARAQTS